MQSKLRILYVCVENLFETGILQSMVLRPGEEISKRFGVDIGFTSVSRTDDACKFVELKRDVSAKYEVIEGKRGKKPVSISNIILFIGFLLQVIWRSRKYDVLHCRSYMGAFIGCISGMLLRKKVIFDVRGYLIDEALEVGRIKRGGLAEKLLRVMERFIFRQSDEVIAVSNAMAKDILERFSRKSTVIPNPTFFPNLPRVERRREVVYNGSLNQWHRPEYFFEAMSVLCGMDTEVMVKVLTNQTEIANSYVSEYGVDPERIEIVSVPAHDVVGQMNGSMLGWCVIEPSFSKSVCAPVKFNEYLAAGVPALVNEGIGDVAKTVESYNVGLVISGAETGEVVAQMILRHLDNLSPDYSVPAELVDQIDYDLAILKIWELYCSDRQR